MKMTKEYIIECLHKYCDFSGELTEENFYDYIIRPLMEAECFEKKDWSYANGVTKCVLLFSGFDFVVKIPFNGYESCGEGHYYDNNGEKVSWTAAHYETRNTAGNVKFYRTRQDVYWDNGEFEFYEFHGAECEYGWDYCEVETIKYADAEAEGVEKFFAKTERVGYVGQWKHPVYIQERCVTFDDETSSESGERFHNRTEADFEKVKTLQDEVGYVSISQNWLLDAIIYYGVELVKKFLIFCENFNISDLHSGNVGYRNGAPCLLDYSSYWDSY